MSITDGMSAMRLEMPGRVPRTEYSAESHWELVKQVTGICVGSESSEAEQLRAGSAFMKAWNYDFRWSTLIGGDYLGKKRTNMGHAIYAGGGADFDDDIGCPFKSPEEVLDFRPGETYGTEDISLLVKAFNGHYRQNCESVPDSVNMTGVYITCISGLLEIFGWDMLLMAMGVDAEGFGEVANRYCAWVQQYFNALADCDSPIVMVHDDIVWTEGPFVHPDWYRKYVFPNYRKLFAPLKESGKKIIFTSDGNYTRFIDDIAECGVNGFVLEPLTDMKYLAGKYGKTHVFIGNADTRALLFGTHEDIYNEVKRCMDIGKACPGFFMAVGNHIPSNTPVENAIYYNEVYEKLSKR